MKTINLNQTLLNGDIFKILDAVITVKGFVIALANPKPVAIIQIKKPVKLSKPIDTVNIIIKGNNVNTSSNNPKKAPNTMNINIINATNNLFLSLNLEIKALTMAFIPLTSFIIWKAPDITNKKIDNIITDNPSDDNSMRIGEKMPFKILIPPTSFRTTYLL